MSKEQLQWFCCQQQHVCCQFLSISPQVTKWLKKKEKWRSKKQGGGIIISSSCDHPRFTSSALTTHLCKWFYMPGPSCKGNLLSQACSQSAVHPRPPQHFVPLVFEHTRCNPYTLLSSKQNPIINKTNSNWGKQLRENDQFFKPLKQFISFPSQIVSFRGLQAKTTSTMKNIVTYFKLRSLIFWIT